MQPTQHYCTPTAYATPTKPNGAQPIQQPSTSKRILAYYAANPTAEPTFDALCTKIQATPRALTIALDTLRRYGKLHLESVRVVRVPLRHRGNHTQPHPGATNANA